MANPEHPLTEREELILQAVVHSYITSADPVGSRAIVKRFGLDISPATVRNVMADLEDAGFLQQLHTSSGRVPTEKGYRYYVDYLMRVQELTETERSRIETEFERKLQDADSVLKQTTQLLALTSHHASIVEAPNRHATELRRIELMPLESNRLCALLVDNYGRVRTMVMNTPESLSESEIGKVSGFLNSHLNGTPLDELEVEIRRRLGRFVDEERKLAENALSVIANVPDVPANQLFLEGATQLFEQPEFQDVGKARVVFGLLDEQDRVLKLLRSGVLLADPRTSRVLIGSDSTGEGLSEISVVSAPYSIGDKTVGMVGILGPRRMHYSKLTGVVEYTAGMLTRLLTRLSG